VGRSRLDQLLFRQNYPPLVKTTALMKVWHAKIADGESGGNDFSSPTATHPWSYRALTTCQRKIDGF
jgi:hypothetical protein